MAKKAAVVRAFALGSTALGVTKSIDEVQVAKGFAITINGLVVDGHPAFPQWQKTIRDLRVSEKGAQFALGDAINFGEEAYGEKASQELDPENGWSLKTIQNYSWLARRIAPDVRRMDRLGVRHHQLVATLAPTKQRSWLHKAAADDEEKPWTVARLKKALDEGEDLPVTGYFVIVTCPTGQAQSELMDRLEAEGLSCKATERRSKKKPVEGEA